MKKGIGENQNLNGALRVVLFMMKQISENRYNDLIKEIDALINSRLLKTFCHPSVD